MSQRLKIVLSILTFAVIIGAIYLHSLQQRVEKMAEGQTSEEKARRAVVAPPISTPTDVPVKARIFWVAADSATKLEPVEVELPLSADPALRSKQVLAALITDPPKPSQRTLPEDTEVLGFYVLPDGTAILDLSDTISTETPSGILSEELAVDSIARTLEANVASLRRLKILIHGQEEDTLAGHLDLTGFFDLHPPGMSDTTSSAEPSPAQPAASAQAIDEGLTASSAPGKLKP
jgi:Sporulation and spore germination